MRTNLKLATRAATASLLVAAILAVPGAVTPAKAGPLDLPGCAVTAGNPSITVSGLAASGFTVGTIGCTDTNPMLVLGASLAAVPGTRIANGGNCLDCSNLPVEAGPAIATAAVHCFVSKAAGSAVGVGLVKPPFDAVTSCQIIQPPPS